MTAESRKAIAGRSPAEDHSLDRLVFGETKREKPEKVDKPAETRERDIKVRLRERGAANDDDVEDAPADPMGVEDISFVERAANDRRRNAERRRGYSRLPDERGNFGSENSKRGPMLAAIAIGVVVVFGAVVWNMYRDGVKSESAPIKPKAIAGGSYKSKPEAEPGADVDGAQVFEQVGAAAGSLDGGPTSPVAEPSISPSPEPNAAPSDAATLAPPSVKAKAKPSPAPAVVASKPEPKPAAPAAVAKPAAAAAPKATPPAAEPVPAVAAKPAGYKPAFAAGGAFVVQLAALASEAEAEAEWTKRAKSAPDLFGSAEKIVVKAEVNGKTVYRLRAGAFANAGDAEAFCAAFKAKGGVCFRATR